MGEREKQERRDERVRREGNGERREDKGREEREKRGLEKGECHTLSTLQTRPNTTRCFANKKIQQAYILHQHELALAAQRTHI